MSKQLEKTVNDYIEGLGLHIEQSMSVNGLLIVRADIEGAIKYGSNVLDRNVYAFNNCGEKVWQIAAAPINRSPKPYVSLEMDGNKLIADNWVGIQLEVDLESGSVAPNKTGQRPW